MQNNFIKYAFRIFGLILGAAILTLSFKSVDLEAVKRMFLDGFNQYLVSAVFFWILGYCFQIRRWQIMLSGRPAAFFPALQVYSWSLLTNLLLPFRAGEGILVLNARTRLHQSVPHLAATLVLERFFNAVMMLCIALILIFVIPELQKFQLSVFVAAIVLTAIPFWFQKKAGAGESMAMRKSQKKGLHRFIWQFGQGFLILKRGYVFGGVLANSLLSWIFFFLGILLLEQNLIPANDAMGALAVLFFINLASLLPLTPANFGPFQWGCILALAYVGVDKTDALSFSLILQMVRIAAIALVVVLGMLPNIYPSEFRKKRCRLLCKSSSQKNCELITQEKLMRRGLRKQKASFNTE